MNKDNNKRCTTVFYTDARSLEDKAVFSQFFSLVNAERQRDIESKRFEKEKVLSLAGGLLLDALIKMWGIPSEIEHDHDGKPQIRDFPGIYVSLSHAYPYAAAMISQAPCGIDLEDRGRDLEAVARHCYSLREKAFAGDSQAKKTDIWCRKECFIKFGGPRDLRKIDTFDIPEDYAYTAVALEGFSFQILSRGEKPQVAFLPLQQGNRNREI